MVKAITGASDTKALLAQAKSVVDGIQRTLQDNVAQDVKRLYEWYARDWSQTPRFKSELENARRTTQVATAGPLALLVFPDVRGRGASPEWTFHWTDKGTSPHTITARRAPSLAFKTNYKPKTRFRALGGGPGIATGPLVRPVSVEHPGTRAREFSAKLLENYKRDYTRTMQKAIGKAARRSRRK